MNGDSGNRIRSIQVILWAALAAVLYSAGFTDGRWQPGAFSVIVFALLCSYSYRNHPTAKRLRGILVVFGIFCVGLIILYFLESRH